MIRANPRIVAQEGQEAKVRVATEQYYQILTGRVGWEYVRLEKIEAPISLTITPRVVVGDGKVTCTIMSEVGDVPGLGPNNLPIITKRTAESTVRIGDGQVIAIGGLLQEIKREIQRKIPLLGDLPLGGPYSEVGVLPASSGRLLSSLSLMCSTRPGVLRARCCFSAR